MYAEWSSKLNREIFSALGDSMANATEALSNIRTVRSFSAEALEERKYLVQSESPHGFETLQVPF